MLKLNVENRDKTQKNDVLRKAGKMPAVFYGKKEKSTPIIISKAEFKKVWKEAGESSVIDLIGKNVEAEALIYDINRDPVTDEPRHADFYVFEKGKKIEISVPLEFVGVAPAVKDMGGTLVKVMHEMEIEALPKDLPHNISVDISPLVNFDSQILAKDVKLPQGVVLITKSEEVIASVYETKEEVEEVAPIDLASIEVHKKGKEAKEGGEAEAEEGAKEEGKK
ncbi:MAG: 50S ribosomal protein L25 [Patescibacteria group bacterium]|nr:50S ribosomal protein L25 [Patescibacteria group bacterium]MDE1988532.1 50S ribosomal protein L25 [Patescibacteria group bacterium]MDE2218278.1 50S ribosomal protein L25 [Patescibacteria group bacterium]